MKISLVLHPRRPLTRAEAWGCLTANLALPGSGSLVAGRAIGYFQILLAIIGLGVTLVTTVQVAFWYFKNYSRFSADPFTGLIELSHALLKPAIGFGIFAVAIFWALMTSWSIIRGTVKS